jgi:hypothetical protein
VERSIRPCRRVGLATVASMSNPPLPDSTLFTAANPPPRPITRPPLVHFTTRDVQPPSIVYVTTDDFLLVELISSVAGAIVKMNTRVLRADGGITYSNELLNPVGNRTLQDFTFKLPEGFLLSIEFSTNSTTVPRGALFVVAAIATGANSSVIAPQLIIADYVANFSPIGFPGGRQISSVEGPGCPTSVPPQAPGVSLGVLITVPTGARWRVQGITWFYTTDAAAGNRFPGVQIFDSLSNPIWLASVFAGIPSSTIAEISAGPCGAWGAGPNNQQILPLPDNLVLQAGAQIVLFQNGGAGGDSIILRGGLVEEWLGL